MKQRGLAALFFFSLASVAWIFAAPEQVADVMDASGHTATSGVLRCVSAGGQSGGFQLSEKSGIRHFGGFVGACTLRPSLDTDADGVANELDADNDGDTLTDQQELSGTPWLPATVSSDPNLTDTDGDGFADGGEATAGTNPTDENSGLWIVDIVPTAGTDVEVSWLARSGLSYRLDFYDNLSGTVVTTHLGSVTVNDPAAVAPWYKTEAFGIDYGVLTNGSSKGFYRVILEP